MGADIPLLCMNVRIDSSWQAVLADEFEKPYFQTLASRVRAEYSCGRIFPPASKIFSAFDMTPFDRVKVVVIGQDPYHGAGQANGLAFSVNDGVAFPPSLRNIFKEIAAETGRDMHGSGNLERWARQGVLLLNSSLTVREGLPNSHAYIGWEILTDAVVDKLSSLREGIVFMLWGANAIRKGSRIDKGRHLVLTSPHPSPLSASRGFFGNGHFVRANEYLVARGESPIEW